MIKRRVDFHSSGHLRLFYCVLLEILAELALKNADMLVSEKENGRCLGRVRYHWLALLWEILGCCGTV